MPSRCEGPYRCPGCPTCGSIPAPRRLTASEERRIAQALRNDPPVYGSRPLRLVQHTPETTTYQAPASCDGTYGCDCERCQQQRLVLVRQGHKHVRQPWQAVRRAA